ncbi:hypothetical protein Q9L58_006955 [Maublancomyces gigas]|uniref:SAP domain-containing protein n=1 Tax=Discina gigas TaxID=1032678 RepID=A0ABR3GEC0_9PEZI
MLDPNTLSSLKVTELKAELKRRGLPVGGLKQALVDRLAEDVNKELEKANAPEPEPEPEAATPADEPDAQGVADDEAPAAVEPIAEPVRAKTPTPTPISEPETVPITEVQAPEATPEAVPAREPTPVLQQMEDTTPEVELVRDPTPVQAEEAMSDTVPERVPTPVPEHVQAREPTPGVEPEREDLQVEEPVQEIPYTEAAKEVPEIAAETTESEEQDVQDEQDVSEEQKTPVQSEEIALLPEAEEMYIDTVVEKTLEEAVTTPLESTKPEEPVDEDVSMSEAPSEELSEAPIEAPIEIPIEAPIEIPIEAPAHPTETQSSTAVAAEITAAITSQSDLAAPPAISEPMDTNEDSATDARKRKRRSASPPPTTDTDTSASVLPELPAPLDDEEEGSVSKRPRQASPPKPRQRDARFKGLFNNGDTLPTMESEAADDARDNAAHDDDDEPPVKPSLHPATRAIYIRNLVRPINEPMLRAHLTTLATGPSTTAPAAPEQIDSFFVDTVKSHALITFASIAAATRVRVGVHGKVWPNDRTRKPLWVDFIPEEKMDTWVETERAGGRWEVVYTVDSEVEGGCRVELVELGGGSGGRGGGRAAGRDAARAAAELVGVPTGPRGGRERKNSVLAVQKAPPVTVSGGETTATTARPRIVDLDELFKSTRAKPKLYYMPVSEATARERLAAQRRDSRGRH